MNMPVCANDHGKFLAEFYMYLLCLCFFQDESFFEQTKPECGAQLNSSSIVQILRQFDRFSLQRRLYYKAYRMVFASICEHARSAFIFASTNSDQFSHGSSEHFRNYKLRAASSESY